MIMANRMLLVVGLALLICPTPAQDAQGFLVGSAGSAEQLYVTHRWTHENVPHTPLTHTRVVHESYSDQVKKAASEAIVGVLLVILAFPVIWFNEKRQVHMEEVFGYARKILKPNVGSENVDNNNDGCLVHMQGVTATNEKLTDSKFGFSFTNCAKMKRSVEMFQWVEHQKTEERDTSGGGKEKITTYSYTQEWRSDYFSSSEFNQSGYYNPPLPFGSQEETSKNVTFGAFMLTEGLIAKMMNWRAPKSGQLVDTCLVSGLTFMQTSPGLYMTNPKDAPQVGDLKVTFESVPCGDATVLALQDGNSFRELSYAMIPKGCQLPWTQPPDRVNLKEPLLGGREEPTNLCACIGFCIESGEQLYELAEEHIGSSEIMARAESKQVLIHLSLITLGYFMFFFGFFLQFKFVPTLFRIIPFIGTWVQYFGNFVAWGAAFFCGCFWWCNTLAFSWLFSRPVRSVLFFTVAIAMVAIPTYLSDH